MPYLHLQNHRKRPDRLQVLNVTSISLENCKELTKKHFPYGFYEDNLCTMSPRGEGMCDVSLNDLRIGIIDRTGAKFIRMINTLINFRVILVAHLYFIMNWLALQVGDVSSKCLLPVFFSLNRIRMHNTHFF